MNGHQISLEECEAFDNEVVIASSTKDEKSLVMRASPKLGIRYAVKKRGTPVQIFTSIAAAVKKYNE